MESFLKRYTTGLPTTLDVMMAQEDFWIYETLLKVVRNTNDFGSDPKHETRTIKSRRTTKRPTSKRSRPWTSARTRSIAGPSRRPRYSNCPMMPGASGGCSTTDRPAPAHAHAHGDRSSRWASDRHARYEFGPFPADRPLRR